MENTNISQYIKKEEDPKKTEKYIKIEESTPMEFELKGHQGLRLWCQTLTDIVTQKLPDLTSRQNAIFLRIYLEPQPHTVRGLAASLNVSKPVITRAIDALSILGFVKRVRDETDKRNVLLQRTVKGAVFLTDFAELMENANKQIQRSSSP